MVPKLYYAKVNVNSNIFQVYSGKTKIKDIMNKLYVQINDKEEYQKSDIRTIEDEEGNLKRIELKETFNFSDIDKFSDGVKNIITGKLVRRFPIHAEEFDPKTRKSEKVMHRNNSASTFFYFDLDNEIITFCEKQKLGYAQFLDAFQNLLDKFTDVGFEIFLIKDPFSIRERVEKAYKINRIKAIVIPPNVNEESLKNLYDKDIEKMGKANITKKTSIFEVNSKSQNGINPKATMVRTVLNLNEAYKTFSDGYGKLEVDGSNRDGSKFHFDSDEHSPYQTIINEEEKKSKIGFIEASKKGIVILRTKRTIERYVGKSE
ncbi:hypothetical protein DCMF_19955 [Candidatus Formimonas warabiya]|uniref:DUF4747 family protein n=1 Tax=Formimonas warabiya TaxID=1761012 RepID=A0A3G1KWA4_FORW1|nr:hypothetical protein DCMF_19955 [Candidatus Formimonas warabiya]